jgi:hypothetical protein
LQDGIGRYFGISRRELGAGPVRNPDVEASAMPLPSCLRLSGEFLAVVPRGLDFIAERDWLVKP